MTLLESMCAQLPIIATDVGGTRDLVVHGESGYLIEPGDVDGIARYLAVLARDEEMRQRMGRAAGRRQIREFTLDGMVNSYARLFKEVADSAH